MKRNKLYSLALATVVLAIAAGLFFFHPFARGTDRCPEKPTSRKVTRLQARQKTPRQDPKKAVQEALSGHRVPKTRVGEKPGFEEFLDELSPGDRKLVLSVQDALDDSNFAAVARTAQKALESETPAVREAAIEALGWFGAEALPDLTPLMADKDDDVAEAAIAQWELALSEIDESETRAAIAEAVVKTLTRKDALESIICEITNQDDDLVVLESLVSIIEGENAAGAEVAREAYETLTGEAWTDIDAANKWLEENYDPPEPDEE